MRAVLTKNFLTSQQGLSNTNETVGYVGIVKKEDFSLIVSKASEAPQGNSAVYVTDGVLRLIQLRLVYVQKGRNESGGLQVDGGSEARS